MALNDIEALEVFLSDARAAGYANVEGAAAEGGADGDTVLRYERGEWRYVDRFVGGDPFSGLELVLRHRRPTFAMGYYGATESAEPDLVFGFLRAALRSGDVRRPGSSAARFERAPFVYEARISGALERFSGEETITSSGTRVYRGWLAGGLVDQRRAL